MNKFYIPAINTGKFLFNMNIITLTSDWGLSSHYVGAVKGVILSYCPEAKIIDISHDIPVFDIHKVSFVLKNSYKYFPKGTIHIIGVNTEASDKTPHMVIEYDGHYFIGSDNGIFSLIFDRKPDKIIELDVIQDSDYFTFAGRDIFAKVACHLAQGKKIEELGHAKNEINELIHPKPTTDKGLIRGTVIFIDTYENVITNITENIFKEIGKGRPFTISFRSYDDINIIHKAYNDVGEGEKLAFFDSSGLLEIAINKGNASNLLGLKINDTIRIEFEDR